MKGVLLRLISVGVLVAVPGAALASPASPRAFASDTHRHLVTRSISVHATSAGRCVGAPLGKMLKSLRNHKRTLAGCPAGSHLVPAATVTCTADGKVRWQQLIVDGEPVPVYENLYWDMYSTCSPLPPSVCGWFFAVAGSPPFGGGFGTPATDPQWSSTCLMTTTKSLFGQLPNLTGGDGFAVAGGGLVLFNLIVEGIG